MIQERYRPDAVIAVGADIVANIAGIPGKDIHPIAEGGSLAELAIACGRQARPNASHLEAIQAMGTGINTSTFPRLLAEGLQSLVQRTFAAQAQHMRWCSIVPISKLGEPVDFLGYLDPVIELLPVNELGVIERFLAPGAAPGVPQVSLTTYGRTVTVTRQAIINDDLGSVVNLIRSLGAGHGRAEAATVATALESNPTMDDGGALFDMLRDNVVTSALDVTSLGQAMAKLRKQRLPNGGLSDLAGRHLVVCADLEVTARQVVSDAGLDNLEVHPMAYLPDARWYLLADQEIQPTIGVLRLFGAKDPTRVEPAPKHALKNFDGTGVRVMADLGATLLSACGIVRGGTVE